MNKTLLFLVLSFLANTFIPFQVTAEDRALIIGINEYEIQPLNGCVTDAENMERVVEEVWGYKASQIKVLFDKEATREAILDAFDNWLIRDTRSGDRVFFYYSGHGTQVDDGDGDEDDGQDEAFCPVDCPTAIEKNAITDDEMNKKLKALSNRQVIFVTDSCHSGTSTRSLAFRESTLKVKRILNRKSTSTPSSIRGIGLAESGNNTVDRFKNVIAYSAVSPSQKAFDGGPNGGIFTNAFIKGIKERKADTDGNGKITHGEVLSYVQQVSQEYCDQHRDDCVSENNGHLTPQLDAQSQWNTVDITARDITPPSPSSSPNDIMDIAEGFDNKNSAQLRVKILPSTTFNLGDKMQFTIKSQRTGYLFLLDINSKGQLMVLFPNKYSKKVNRESVLEAGQTITIPDDSYNFDFEAQEPTGKGLLLALLIEENEEFVKNMEGKLFDLPAERGFIPIEKPDEVNETLVKLYHKLHQTILGSEGVGRPIKWSVEEVGYEINK